MTLNVGMQLWWKVQNIFHPCLWYLYLQLQQKELQCSYWLLLAKFFQRSLYLLDCCELVSHINEELDFPLFLSQFWLLHIAFQYFLQDLKETLLPLAFPQLFFQVLTFTEDSPLSLEVEVVEEYSLFKLDYSFQELLHAVHSWNLHFL